MTNTTVGQEGPPFTVPLVPVDSSNIAAVGYAAEDQKLIVRFKNGGTYMYAGVPPEIHAQLMAAPSLGRYLHLHIKPLYPVTRLAPKIPPEGGG